MLFDIAVIGATGYTGKYVLRHLVQSRKGDGTKFRIAACGRNAAKLHDTIDWATQGSKDTLLEWRVVDATNLTTVEPIIKSAGVVVACVGPFIKYGKKIAESCVENQTHYVDITGEVDFGQWMIDTLHEKARRNQTCLVPFAGVDCIPADVGAYYAVQETRKKYGKAPNRVKTCVMEFSGEGASDGTMQTIVTNLTTERDESVMDCFALNPKDAPNKPAASIPDEFEKDYMKLEYDSENGIWQGTHIMQFPDVRVVRRTAELLAIAGTSDRYADSFMFSERSGKLTLFSALRSLLVLMSLLLLRIGLIRRFVIRENQSGGGPSEGSFGRLVYCTESEVDTGESLKTMLVMGHPYRETGRMAAEVATYLHGTTSPPGGVQTPVTATRGHIIRILKDKLDAQFAIIDGPFSDYKKFINVKNTSSHKA